MRKIIRIITIAVFVITAIPISTCLRKGAERDIEQYKEARKVNTEEAFAEALKTDGWIYADGAFIGKAPLDELRKSKRSRKLKIESFLHKGADVNRIVDSLMAAGDYIEIRLTTGTVLRENKDDVFKINKNYTAYTCAESVTFLGQTFEAKLILPQLLSYTIAQQPRRGDSYEAYEITGVKSPSYTWLKVNVSNGQIVENDLSIFHESAVESLKEAAEGDGEKYKNYTIGGFLVTWLILMFVVLWLEGKYIKR